MNWVSLEKWLKLVSKSIYFKILAGSASVLLVVILALPGIIDFFERREPVDVSGQWKIVFEITESSYRPYINTRTGYKVFFTQKDQKIVGKGESWEYESDLHFEAHRPIEFEGKIDGYLIESNYTLFGKERTTVGIVTLEIIDIGRTMKGDFVGTGADVKGVVTAEKII